MSAWDELTHHVNDSVAEATALLIEKMFELIDQYIEQKVLEEVRANQIYEEAMKQVEAQLKHKIDAELKEAEQKQPEIPLNKLIEQEAFLAEPTIQLELHTQATEQLKKEIYQHLSKEFPSLVKEEKTLTFDTLEDREFIFLDQEQNRYSIHEKELPLSLETKAMIDAYQYMKNEGKEQVLKDIREAQKAAEREGRPAQEVYAEKTQKDVVQNVMKYRFAHLSQIKDAMDLLDRVKKGIRTQEKDLNHQIKNLNKDYREGKIGKEAFEKEKEKLSKSKEHISKNIERCRTQEGRLKQGLQGELKKMFPEMKVNHLSLKSAFEITAAVSGKEKPFKSAKELNHFLKEKNFPNLSKEVEKGLGSLGKESGIELNAFAK